MKKQKFKDMAVRDQLRYLGKKLWNFVRYIFSTCLLLSAIGIVLYGIVEKKSNFWPETIPFEVTIIILICLLWILAVLEGFEVIAVELHKNPVKDPKRYPRAHRVQQIVAQGNHLAKFVLGRQVLVLITVFFLARCTTILNAEVFPSGFSAFLATGLMGTVIVVILGQLVPQILAAQYPVHFANFPLMEFVLRICLLVEASGAIHAAWILGPTVCKILRFKPVRLEEDVGKPTLLPKNALGYTLSRAASTESLSLVSQGQIDKLAGVQNFASVGEVVTSLTSSNLVIPYFLLDPSNSSHIPPNIASLILHAQHLLLLASECPNSQEKQQLEDQARQFASLALMKEPDALED